MCMNYWIGILELLHKNQQYQCYGKTLVAQYNLSYSAISAILITPMNQIIMAQLPLADFNSGKVKPSIQLGVISVQDPVLY